MDGLNVEGAAVLMDFNSGDAWVNAAQLGAKAIVFVEPDSTVYLEGEKKFLSLPLDVPSEEKLRRFLRSDLYKADVAARRLRRQVCTVRIPPCRALG